MQRGLLLDAVVSERAPILKPLPSIHYSLLTWRDSLLVLDLALDQADSICVFRLKCDDLCLRRSNESHRHQAVAFPPPFLGRLFWDVTLLKRLLKNPTAGSGPGPVSESAQISSFSVKLYGVSKVATCPRGLLLT